MAQNTKLVSMLESNISGKKEEAGSKSPATEKQKSRSAFANTARKTDTMRMRIVFHCPRTRISAQFVTRNRMVRGLGIVT